MQSSKVVLGCAMHSERCISAVLQYIRTAAKFSSTLILHNVSLQIDSVVVHFGLAVVASRDDGLETHCPFLVQAVHLADMRLC